jgi:hypothetical protein
MLHFDLESEFMMNSFIYFQGIEYFFIFIINLSSSSNFMSMIKADAPIINLILTFNFHYLYNFI